VSFVDFPLPISLIASELLQLSGDGHFLGLRANVYAGPWCANLLIPTQLEQLTTNEGHLPQSHSPPIHPQNRSPES